MKTDMKPNLYASLDMIPKIGTNGSKQWSKRHSKWSPTSYISQKRSKGSEMVQNYRKGCKNFQKIEKFL